MELGMIGLGRMGANMVLRLQAAGHRCVVHDRSAAAVESLVARGATGATSIADLVAALTSPRAVWVMVPAGVTDAVVREVAAHLEPGDAVIDGGNSRWTDDIARAADLAESGVDHLDVGTSGGVWGRERGYCLMVGGPDEAVERLAPVFTALAPGTGRVERTPGRRGDPAPEEQGWLHCGPAGAGHFVKMVHNGIEYGLMAAYAEGLNLLANAGAGNAALADDAETAPLEHPDHYRYDLDLAAVTELWRRGSVISSWLLDLTAGAVLDDPGLSRYGGRVSDSGEGRWTVDAAVDVGVPVPVIASALFGRFASQGRSLTGDRVQSAMRHAFGGHLEVGEDPDSEARGDMAGGDAVGTDAVRTDAVRTDAAGGSDS
jgi:6-phosphogluconate dehydrogenase